MPRIYKPVGPPSNKAADPVEEVKSRTPANQKGAKSKDGEKKGDGQ